MIVRKRIVVHGKVQGVGFRYATQTRARKIGGIAGWVRNRPDNTVEIFAQGLERDVDELLAWCYRGSELAEVERVEWKFEDINVSDEFFREKDFYITDDQKRTKVTT